VKPQFQRPDVKVFYSTSTGLPSFIRSSPKLRLGARSLPVDPVAGAYSYLETLKPLLSIPTTADFTVREIRTGNNNDTHIRMDQKYKGIPVYAAEIIVHLNRSGEGEAFNGSYLLINDDISVNPALSMQSAVQRVTGDIQRRSGIRILSAMSRRLVEYAEPKATLCIYQDKGLVKTNVLTYHVISCPSIYERWEYFVDASTGAILHQVETTCAVDGPRTASGADLNGVARTINTYQSGANYMLVDISRTMYKALGSVLPDEPLGGILTIDMNNTSGGDQAVQHVLSAGNSWTAATQIKGLSAHHSAGIAYEYFRTKHGRNSIDGEGGTMISIVNVPDEDGASMGNAYWNGKAIFYGNGDSGFKPLAGALDVAGHEMTHGVVQSTANLEYEGEAGAINESMADIFGSMMDPADWLIGEDVVKTASFPTGAMRSLENPHNGGSRLGHPGYQPMHTNEAYTGSEDNGGVHINSGIANHAFYLYAEAISRAKAADVYYRALDLYLTKSSQFIDLRLAVIQAAEDIFNAGSSEVTQAGLAFDAVGISTGEGGDYTETLPSNPGSEFLLVYNLASDDPNTLYRSEIDGNDAVELTTTVFNSRPSVTDKGDVAVFVAEDHTIHMIRISPGSSPVETVFHDDPLWSNVVISKGGSKLAAVMTNQQPKIYVYDFGTSVWGEFDLYNPTYSEGVNSAGPVYADALEWDYNGEFLVYDCFNRIDANNAAPIEYWDVNFIHVWDKEADDFGDGTIEKLFSSLPDGVSIGNPSFAKNSPNILAFDYIDEGADEYAILGCNIETNDVNVIVENNTLGFPSYNKTDERLAFTTLDETDDSKVAYLLLNSDKISTSDEMVSLFRSTQWPVYFATGEREIGDEVITGVPEEKGIEPRLICYPNPFVGDVQVTISDPSLVGGRVIILNAIGQRAHDIVSPVQGVGPLVFDLQHLTSGQYFMQMITSGKTVGCKLVKK
jgi:Zn-dependent metalloprotease